MRAFKVVCEHVIEETVNGHDNSYIPEMVYTIRDDPIYNDLKLKTKVWESRGWIEYLNDEETQVQQARRATLVGRLTVKD